MDKYLIKLSDDELLELTAEELLQIEADAEEFDGFCGWIAVKTISDEENDLQGKNKENYVRYLRWQGTEARHACTKADFCLLPKITTNAEQRIVR